jgi:toxin FitB
MAFLLDTNVVSELRKRTPNRQVLAWHQAHATADVYLSVLVLGEIRQGIERLRDRDERRAEALERWLDRLAVAYRDRVLPVTADIAVMWGRLNGTPQPPPVVDGLIAATAIVHRLILVTRHSAEVARTGVQVVNPFDGA